MRCGDLDEPVWCGDVRGEGVLMFDVLVMMVKRGCVGGVIDGRHWIDENDK